MYKDQRLSDILIFYSAFTFLTAITFNFILLYMVIFKHHRELGTYRFLLLAFVLADIFYTISHTLTVPIPEVYKNAMLMGGHGLWTSRNAMSMWLVVYSVSFSLLCYNFLYRLVAVKYPLSIKKFTRPHVLVLMAMITFAICATWSGVLNTFWLAEGENREYIRDLFNGSSYPTYVTHDMENIANYMVVLFWKRKFLDGINWPVLLASVVLCVTVLGSYNTMICAAYKIIKYLNKGPHLSIKSHKLHVQLFRALILQAITPIFTAYGPVSMCCWLPFFGLDIPVFSVFCPLFCAIHPVMDSCIMLSTVALFRKTLLDGILCRRSRRNSKVMTFENSPEQEVDMRVKRKLSDAYTGSK